MASLKKTVSKNKFSFESRPLNVSFFFIFASVFTLNFTGLNRVVDSPAPQVVTELRCNEGTGTTTADASGNNHTGTFVNGPLWTTGKYGQGISLDGTNDYVNIADHANFTLDPAQSYTWSGWVRNNNFTQWSTIWSQTLDANNFLYFYTHSTNDADGGPVTNGISIYWWGNGGTNRLALHSNNNVLTTGVWNNIAITYNASQPQNNRFTIYVNGVDVTNRTDVSSAGTISTINPTNTRIGSNQPFGEYLNGAVDEIRYYRRLLSQAEVQSDMNIGSGPDTTLPTATITAPAAGNVTGTINVNANASDNVGVVGVQFLLDGVNLGAEDLTAPYSVSWNTTTATNGNHNLTARARDAVGNLGTSAIVVVNVNNDSQLPTATITAPLAGNVSGTINVDADAADNVGVVGVQFLLDGVNLGAEDLVAPYSVSWNTTTAGNGNHNLTARARDAAGNLGTSAVVVVNVNNADSQLPTATITAPTAGNVTGTINVDANASDNIGVVGVQFLLDGVDLGSEDLTAPYSVSWNTTTATNGNHNLTARARDAAGNLGTSAIVVVNVNNDTQLPTATITAPAAGNVSGTINVDANAADNIGVVGVQFLLDGVSLGAEDLVAPYSVSWNTTTAANGNHNLTARARDAAGNLGTSAIVVVNVNNDTQLPTATITAPAAGNVSGTINVDANAADNVGVVGVQFLLDGVNLGTEDLVAPYSVSWNTTTATNGNHNLTARARDAAGNLGTSAVVVVNVNNIDTELPTATITSPAAGNVSGTINVNANATDNIGVVGVQFLLNGANLGAEDLVAPYSISWNTLTSVNSPYTLTARARDAAGNLGNSAGVNVTVNNTGTLVLAMPCNEGTNTVAGDISGNGHNGTLTNGPTWSAGKYGQGISLDGTNDYVGIADHANFTLDPAQSYTWSGWVRNNNFTQWSTIWSQTLDANNFLYFYTHSTNDADGGPVTNGISIYWWGNGGTNRLALHSNNNVLTTGVWNNIAITYNASQPQNNRFTIYVNGVDVTNRTDVSSAGTISTINPTNTRIGSNQPFGEYLNGAVDEIRYYRRLLSQAEVQSDMNIGSGPDTTLPTATITAPAAGNVTGTINVNANASDNVGVVGVQFLLDGVNLGAEDLTAPYSVSWNTTTATNGNHNLTARARDAVGNLGTSAIVVVNVNNDSQLPTATITAPLAGNVSGTINVDADAADNVGVVGVQFLLDGVNLGAEDLVAPYSVSWNTTTAGNGNHNLTARARDAAGNLGTSAVVVVNVNNADSQLPTATITAPTAGNVTGTINVDANASDNIGVVGVQFLLDGVDLGSEDLTAPYSVSWNTTTATNGNHNLTARARDAAGNLGTSAIVVVNVNNDTQLPTATITAPAAGNVSGTINVDANAADNIGVVGVQFLLDGVSLGAEDLVAPYSVSWNTTTAANGNHNLTARARDAAGNLGTSAIVVVNVNNDTQLPTATITAPAAGNVSGTINVDANAADNVGVVGVQFLLDGVNLGTEDLVAPYSVSWNTTTATNGNHNLTARARDAAGNLGTSAVVVVNVNNIDTELPTATITSPAAGNVSGTINVNANAADNIGVVGVQFLLNGANLGAEDLVAPYSVSWNTLSASNGPDTLTARARDAAGNTATSSGVIVTVNNDTQLPTVSITSPAAGNVSGTINVNANATDNVGVVGVQFLLNGANLGTEDVVAPYSVSWNTASSANGNYTLTARARDAAGNNATSTGVAVTVNNNTTLISAHGLNENTGINATDISGNNHTAVLTNGPAWTAGKYGQGISLDGVDDYLNIADHANFTLDPSQNYTWSAWVRNNNFAQWSTVWSQTIDANSFFYFYAHTSGDADAGPVTNGVSVFWWTGNNRVVLHSNDNVLTVGQWSYITVAYNASLAQNNRFTIFVNGLDVTNRTDVVSGGTLSTLNPSNIRIGSNQPFGENLNGSIDEVRFYKRLLSQAEVQTDMNTPIGVDNIAPTVSITTPAADSIVTGTINIIANASDNAAVAGVQFMVDGVDVGLEDLTAPYSASWNTSSASGGNHTLTARARDAAGNTTISAGVVVVVNADFSFTVLNPTRSVGVTGSIDFGVAVAYLNGFTSSNVVLSVTGLPANVTGNYLVNPMTDQGQTQLIINTNNATPGTYTLNLSATAGSKTHSQQATLIINGPADFALSASPSVQNVTAGSGISYTITISETGGDFLSPVTLSVTGLHATMTAIFNPTSSVPASTSVLTITTTASTPNGTFNFTVQGESGALIRTTPISLTVNSTPPPTWPVTNLGSGWDMPIGAAFSKDGQKLFVWEKGGKVFVCNRNAATQLYDKQTTPVLDISPEVGNWDDMGLTGFALDPAFETNGLIYLLYIVDRHYLLNFGTPNYNPPPADNVSARKATIGRVTRYQTSINGGIMTANLPSRTILLGETKSTGVPILYDSHGVGTIAFAADGTLIISAGDGANYTGPDVGGSPGSYFLDALADGIIRSEENVGAFRSQMINTHSGKFLRIDPVTGDGIPSNPYYSAATPRAPKSKVWALGVRNPFRFTIRPGTGATTPEAGDIGEIYFGDVGWSTYEELNIIKAPAQNFGWPLFEGINGQKSVTQDPNYITYNTQNRDEPNPLFGIGGCNQQFFTFNNLIKQATADGSTTVYNPCNASQPITGGNPNRFVHRRPVIDWKQYTDSSRVPIFNGNNSAFAQIGTAASGVDGTPFPGNTSIGGFWYTGNLFPANFRNTYFHADYGAKWMKTFNVNYTDVITRVQDFASGFIGIVCLVENPLDGTLVYVDIGNNTVKRISYGGNQYPVVNMTSNVQYGPSALNVSFTGSNSFDPEGGRVTYLWNFGDATTSTLANPSHSFTSTPGVPRKFTVTLTVRDSVNFTSIDSIIISVNNTPPMVHITSPVDSSTYNLGADSVYAFTATVSDAEHSPSQLKYEWQKILRHNNHEHPGPIDTARNTSAAIPRIGCNGETYYTLVRLKVTDAAGLSTSDSSKIFPACQGGRVLLVLRQFSVTQEDAANLVKWSTEAAFQVERFEVERSVDGINFFAINQQPARRIAGKQEYDFSDIGFPVGTNYYRLKMIEIGDVIRYSGIVKTFTGTRRNELIISPNPIIGNFSILYDAKDQGAVVIRISDLNGRLVKTIHESVNKGQNIIYIENMPDWKPGMYMISVEQGNDKQYSKLIKAE